MSLQTPTTKETSDLAIAQFEASLGQSIPFLPKSFLRVLAKVMAGMFMLLYKYAGFIFLQMFVRTATYDTITVNGKRIRPLQEWGRLIGEADRQQAEQAELTIDVTVTNQSDSLPSGSQLVSSSNGVTYITVSSVLLNSATVSVTVRAVSDQSGGNGAGAIGNLDNGAELTFANPLGNVRRTAVVTGQTVQGADAEAVEAYRTRIIKRFQRRPQGGAYVDYELWGLEPAGVINIYPYTGKRAGEVDVYAEATTASSGNADGVPTQAQLDEVAASIELDDDGLASRRPANAGVNVFPITRLGFTVTVVGLDVSLVAQTQDQIENAVTEFFLQRAPFIDGLSQPPRLDRITRTALTGVVDDIVSEAGGIFQSVELRRNGSQITSYILGIGEKSKLSSITFTG